jgi:putative transposase
LKDSDGRRVNQPNFYADEIKELRRLSRSLSRKKEGSRNRAKSKYRLFKWHRHISEKRKQFLWTMANFYTNSYGIIRIPKMPLKEKIMHATTSKKAQKLCDAAYGIFCSFIKFKASEKGVIVEEYAL